MLLLLSVVHGSSNLPFTFCLDYGSNHQSRSHIPLLFWGFISHLVNLASLREGTVIQIRYATLSRNPLYLDNQTLQALSLIWIFFQIFDYNSAQDPISSHLLKDMALEVFAFPMSSLFFLSIRSFTSTHKHSVPIIKQQDTIFDPLTSGYCPISLCLFTVKVFKSVVFTHGSFSLCFFFFFFHPWACY